MSRTEGRKERDAALAHWGTGAVGVATLTAGTVAVFVSDNAAGTAALVGAGTVLTALVLLGDRLQSFEAAGVKVQLAVAAKLKGAEAAELGGNPAVAEKLREEAEALADQAHPFAKSYGLLRGSLARSPERSRAMEQLMGEARRAATDRAWEPQRVRNMLINGDEGTRAFALGLMEGDQRLAQVDAIATAIRDPKSRFEQWHALSVAEQLLDGLDESGRKLLEDAVTTALADHAYMDSPDRRELAERVLSRARTGG